MMWGLQEEMKLQKCIRMRIAIFKILIWVGGGGGGRGGGGYLVWYTIQNHVLRHHQAKFPTVYLTIYLPK